VELLLVEGRVEEVLVVLAVVLADGLVVLMMLENRSVEVVDSLCFQGSMDWHSEAFSLGCDENPPVMVMRELMRALGLFVHYMIRQKVARQVNCMMKTITKYQVLDKSLKWLLPWRMTFIVG
jgi:hypothetical protein